MVKMKCMCIFWWVAATSLNRRRIGFNLLDKTYKQNAAN